MQKFLFRTLANIFQTKEPKLNILIYHRVMPEPDPLRPWEIDKHQFRNHLEWVSGVFNVIPLAEAIEQLKSGCLQRRSLCITFDDGYRDNASEALPILKAFGHHATFFCTSAWLEGGLMFNDQVIETIRVWPQQTISINEIGIGPLPVTTVAEKSKAITTILPKLKYVPHEKRREIAASLAAQTNEKLPDLMMRAEHLRELHENGMTLGGHTHSHPIIAELSDEQLANELTKNKQTLESIIGAPLTLFAYPNGKPGVDFTAAQQHLIRKAGFQAALTTQAGVASKATELFTIPRFTPWDKNPVKFCLRMIVV